jgi:hypothetical protein
MLNKPAKFAWVILVACVAGLPLMMVPRAASAADDCLTEPKGPTPSGKHWRYHTERGTGRHCWYLRGDDDATASTTAQDQSAATDDEASSTQDEASSTQDQVGAGKDQAPLVKPPTKQITKQIETPATRSIVNARAELPTKAHVDDAGAAPPAVAPAPPNAPNASVWPNPQAALAARPVVDASSSDTDTQPDTTASVAAAEPSPSPAPVAQAPPPGDRQVANGHRASIPMLLLVAFGALGLAGLTGSTVYRLASVGRRVRSQDRWRRNITAQPAPARRPPRHIPARPEPVQDNFVQDNFVQDNFVRDNFAQDEFEQDEFKQDAFEQDAFEQNHFEPEHPTREPVRQARVEPRLEAPRAQTRTSDGNNRRKQIEAHLVQLTRQLQADLQASARAK